LTICFLLYFTGAPQSAGLAALRALLVPQLAEHAPAIVELESFL
jgi:hypothetical protein